MDITIPGVAQPIAGSGPIVILGPNGVGKTQLGVAIKTANNGERIAALRAIELGGIGMAPAETARTQYQQALVNTQQHHWGQSSELSSLMQAILADDTEQARRYRDFRESNPNDAYSSDFVNTRRKKINDIWNRFFPGRTISLDYSPQVTRRFRDGAETKYDVARMSEGERTALYMCARVMSCTREMMVIDEPETFFHPLLARELWDTLEDEAPNIRFVYITHDIPFALSRRNTRFVIARSESAGTLLPEKQLPAEVFADVLGAASFSIYASRLIFCEGDTKGLDFQILSAWHNCQKTAVVPVGGCLIVRECVSAFGAGDVIAGLQALGYVDRDGRPDTELATRDNVRAHPVSEIEGLFCLEPIFLALAAYNSVTDPAAAYGAFIAEARNGFNGINFNKETLGRAKLRVESEQLSMLNPVKPNTDLATERAAFVAAAPPGGWPSYLATVFDEERARLQQSLGSRIDFIRDFPAKSYIDIAARHIGFIRDKMIEAFCRALLLTNEAAQSNRPLGTLRDAIVQALTPHMWPRAVE